MVILDLSHADLPARVELRGDTIYADDKPVAKLLSDTPPVSRFATMIRAIERGESDDDMDGCPSCGCDHAECCRCGVKYWVTP